MPVLRFVFVLAAVLAATAVPCLAQRGDYFNVESPQVHPIEVADVDGREYLLVVNTPDNSMEVRTADSRGTLLYRFRTGLEPVSVRWDGALRRWYTANFLGDSITMGALWHDLSGVLQGDVIQTTEVMDEPLDVIRTQFMVVVPHMTLDTLGFYGALDLKTMVGPYAGDLTECQVDVDPECDPADATNTWRFRRYVPKVVYDEDLDGVFDEPVDDIDEDELADEVALKQPWTAVVADCSFTGRLMVLGHLGGNARDTETYRYDADVYSRDVSSLLTDSGGQPRMDLGLGSTNWNMTLDEGGRLWVVGAEAVNLQVTGEANVAAEETGFVRSHLYLVESPCSEFGKLEPIPDPPSTGVRSRDANRSDTGAVVAKHEALAQLTDVATFGIAGNRTRVCVAAFGSDRIGFFDFDPMNPDASAWTRNTLDITPPGGGPMAGPRGLALSGGTSPLLFVLNRLDNSVSVVDPITMEEEGDGFTLGEKPAPDHDPTPDYMRAGRPFLYDADLSGNGFTSCASCHVDGRTDGLAWDLSGGGTPVDCDGDTVPETPPGDACIPLELITPATHAPDGERYWAFPSEKSFLVTQSLQGLLNWEIAPDDDDGGRRFELVTNAPYHWRGDRADFTAFGGAFESLLGLTAGVSDEDMKKFEEFIGSIHYPPNPRQANSRTYSGELGCSMGSMTGEKALQGLRLFHERETGGGAGPTTIGESCVACHSLPEGSNNVLSFTLSQRILPSEDGELPTDLLRLISPGGTFAPNQPQETAALRGLVQKDARREITGSSQPKNMPITGYEGQSSTGVFRGGIGTDDAVTRGLDFNGNATLNGFVARQFLLDFGTPEASIFQFLHELDTGQAPIIGRSFTCAAWTNWSTAYWDEVEEQANLGNAGVAVQAWYGPFRIGYWFDPTVNAYRREDTGPYSTTLTTRQILIDSLLTPYHQLVVISTPLGSERRIADPKGQPANLAPMPVPSDLKILPMSPNSAHELVPCLTENWLPGPRHKGGDTVGHTIQLYQEGLIQTRGPFEPTYGYEPDVVLGVAEHRHVVPRRFRVAGNGLVHGAKLHVLIHDDESESFLDPRPPDPEGVADPIQWTELELPLFPTSDTVTVGAVPDVPVWETAVELEPLVFFRMIAGRPAFTGDVEGELPGLTDIDHARADGLTAIDFSDIAMDTFAPEDWNWHYAWIVNGDGVSTRDPMMSAEADPGWFQLELELPTGCPTCP